MSNGPRTIRLLTLALAAGLVVLAISARSGDAPAAGPYRSPLSAAFDPAGTRIAASDWTAGKAAIIDVAGGKVAGEVELRGRPAGVAWSPDGSRLYVAECDGGAVAEIDPAAMKVARRLAVGLRPAGIAIAPSGKVLLAANGDSHSVSIVEIESGKELKRIPAEREPFAISITADGKSAIVSNLLPATRATDIDHAAALTVIDLEKLEKAGCVRLPPGSTDVRQTATSPDGKWAYAVHTVGRNALPTTQLDRGWVNTNALSIIDIASRTVLATVLLDHPMEGSADPWGLAVARDGKRIWVSISGTHRVARIELATLHEYIDGKLPKDHFLAQASNYSPGTESIWLRIQRDPAQKAELVNDLASLTAPGLIAKFPAGGKGPRGIDVSADGKLIACAVYFAGKVSIIDAESGKMRASVALGPDREPDLVRKGEIAFHDADLCFQKWLSCATCHPDGRADGMNWDLLNDGIGNPKNARSMLWSDRTPPVMSHGVRRDMKEAVKAGFVHILFHQPDDAELSATEAYLVNLTPLPSPRLLPDGTLSEKAKRGKALFEDARTACSTCHPGPVFTDLKAYDVGTKGELDRATSFDTPTLAELYRTGPFLHDGSAVTLREVLVEKNREDKHGTTKALTPAEIDDLVEYLESL